MTLLMRVVAITFAITSGTAIALAPGRSHVVNASSDLPATVRPINAPLLTRSIDCTLTYGARDACEGLIKDFDDFVRIPTRAKLDEAVRPLRADNSTKGRRHGKCPAGQNCKYKQYVWHKVNYDSRRMDISQLDYHQGIVVGSMKFLADAISDIYYDVGYDLPRGDDEQTAWVVVEKHPHPPNPAVIAKWTLFGFSKSSRSFGPLKSSSNTVITGNVHLCNNEHRKEKRFASAFLTCESEDELFAFSDKVGITLTEARFVFTCDVAGRSLQSRAARCAEQREQRLRALLRRDRRGVQLMTKVAMEEAVTLLRGVKANPDEDPYWFSCASGCCTAEM